MLEQHTPTIESSDKPLLRFPAFLQHTADPGLIVLATDDTTLIVIRGRVETDPKAPVLGPGGILHAGQFPLEDFKPCYLSSRHTFPSLLDATNISAEYPVNWPILQDLCHCADPENFLVTNTNRHLMVRRDEFGNIVGGRLNEP